MYVKIDENFKNIMLTIMEYRSLIWKIMIKVNCCDFALFCKKKKAATFLNQVSNISMLLDCDTTTFSNVHKRRPLLLFQIHKIIAIVISSQNIVIATKLDNLH